MISSSQTRASELSPLTTGLLPSTRPSEALELLTNSNGAKVQLVNVNYDYDAKQASPKSKLLHNISLTLNPNTMVALMGPSGCGKT